MDKPTQEGATRNEVPPMKDKKDDIQASSGQIDQLSEEQTTHQEVLKLSNTGRWRWACLLVSLLASSLYSHPTMLHGLTPWSEILKRDFWGGDQLVDPKSHKSFRPIVTASLRLNYMHAVHYWHRTMNDVETFGFHLTNVVLHVLVSLLCLPASFYAFGANENSFLPSLLTSILFAVTPIHSEAVQNITGRAEPMMSLFYLLGFVVYASSMMKHRTRDSIWPNRSQLCALFTTVLLAILSLLCKELGITVTMLCSFWDFFVVEELSLQNFLLYLPFLPDVVDIEDDMVRSRRQRLTSWSIRTLVLGLATIVVGMWRLSLNGGNPPFLRYNANRHGIEVDFSSIPPELIHGGDSGVHGIYRWCSIAWLWVRYVQLCVFPLELSADWSGPAISLIRSLTDHRVSIMVILFSSVGGFLLVAGFRSKPWSAPLSAFGFFLFPFILSSNLFVVVGTTIAERVAYLPSLGICMGMALLFVNIGPPLRRNKLNLNVIVRIAMFLVVCSLYSMKCVERNFAWSSSKTLWAEAYRVNPTSSHSIQNYAVNMLGESDLSEVQKAADALSSIRTFDEINRVDADEMYSPLVLCLRRLGKWKEALEAGAEAWERCRQREEAYNRGVKIWHMHELTLNVEKFPLRKARILAAQATTLAHLDLKETAVAALLAAELAPNDSVVLQMVQDLERYAMNSYFRYEGAELGEPKPLPTQMFEAYAATWRRNEK